MEEHWVGGRLFKKLDDGRLVEVAGDGTLNDTYTVGGETFDSYSADPSMIEDARSSHYSRMDETEKYSGSPKPIQDSRTKKFKSNYSGFVKRPLSEILADTQKGHSLAGDHSLDAGHDLGGPTGLIKKEAKSMDLFKKKIGTFTEHMERVQQAHANIDQISPFTSNPMAKSKALRGKDRK